MAIYSIGVRTTSTTTGAACFEIRSNALNRPRILEIGISINAATASVFGLGRPQAIGITPTTPVDMQGEDGADPIDTTFETALAWATPPTVPLVFLRRVSTPATIGAGVIWTFPNGLVIPVSFSIVVWNITTTSLADIWVVADM